MAGFLGFLLPAAQRSSPHTLLAPVSKRESAHFPSPTPDPPLGCCLWMSPPVQMGTDNPLSLMFLSLLVSNQDPGSHPGLWILLPAASLNSSPPQLSLNVWGCCLLPKFLPSGLPPSNPFSSLLPSYLRICMSSLRRGHANLLRIFPVLVSVLPRRALPSYSSRESGHVASIIFRIEYRHERLSVT